MFANILNTFFSFFPIVFISKHALHNWFYTLIEKWCRNTVHLVIHSVKNKVIYKNYVFFVTSRSRTFRFGRNKELILTNKQTQFCKKLLFLRDTREKCFLRYREPATPGYYKAGLTPTTPVTSIAIYPVKMSIGHKSSTDLYLPTIYIPITNR